MGWPRVKIGVLKFHLRRLRPRVREFVFVRIPSEAVRRAGHVKKAVQQELVGGRRRANLPPTQCRQMGRDRSGDFRYSPAREVISFSKSFEQLDELELIDAGAIEYRLDDRGFFPSREQKLGAAEDRPFLPSRFRQETNGLGDLLKPLAFAGDSRPSANNQVRHPTRHKWFDAALDQHWFVAGRSGRCRDALNQPANQPKELLDGSPQVLESRLIWLKLLNVFTALEMAQEMITEPSTGWRRRALGVRVNTHGSYLRSDGNISRINYHKIARILVASVVESVAVF